MSGVRRLQPLERRLARSLMLVSLVASLTWFVVFFASGGWVQSDGEVVFALTLFVGGMVWAGFTLVAFLLLVFGVRRR